MNGNGQQYPDLEQFARERQQDMPEPGKMLVGSKPANLEYIPRNIPREPKDTTVAYRVRTRGGLTTFRRCGILFGPDEVPVAASSLTREQARELINTPCLHVVELTAADLPKELRGEPAPAGKGARALQ